MAATMHGYTSQYVQMNQVKQEPVQYSQNEYWQQTLQYTDYPASQPAFIPPIQQSFFQQQTTDYNYAYQHSSQVASYVTCKTEEGIVSEQLARSNCALEQVNIGSDDLVMYQNSSWQELDYMDEICQDRNSPFKHENSPSITLTPVEDIGIQTEQYPVFQFDSSDLTFDDGFVADSPAYETEVETTDDSADDVQVEISDDESISSEDSGYRDESDEASCSSNNNYESKISPSRKQPILWKFLIKVLNDPEQKYSKMVRWVDKSQGVFEFTTKHKEEVAEHWGRLKRNRCKMNYQKLARALRNYGKKGIVLRKVKRKLQYTFLPEMQKHIQSSC